MVPERVKVLNVYLDETDTSGGRPTYLVLLDRMRREGLAGATVLRGLAGYGAHREIHTASILDLAANLPIIVQAIDEADKIAAFLPVVAEVLPGGMATVHEADIVFFRRNG